MERQYNLSNYPVDLREIPIVFTYLPMKMLEYFAFVLDEHLWKFILITLILFLVMIPGLLAITLLVGGFFGIFAFWPLAIHMAIVRYRVRKDMETRAPPPPAAPVTTVVTTTTTTAPPAKV